ncbi:MAG: DUF4124 domain-containing protein [Gammaproteobacteria bacterium]|nr:MAG: DUF4124 domain-containing protein [Gammaproteobacteria bacterium]
MMKLLFKVVVLVGIMLTVPYYLLGSGAMPDFLKNMIGSGQSEQPALPKNLSSVTTDKNVTVYKCKDASGQIQFSDTPCGNGETIHLRPDTNVVQAVKVPEKEEEASGGSLISLGSKKDKDGNTELPNPYSPEGVQQIIKDAQNAAELMNKRNQETAKAMDM